MSGEEKICDGYCRGCAFYGSWYEGNEHCNYYLLTGNRRPCDPGEGCTVRKERENENGQHDSK